MKDEDDAPPSFLVKWRSLPYASCTWESTRTLLPYQSEIRRFRERQATPPPLERKVAANRSRPPKGVPFKKLTESPVVSATGFTLRSYQLEGLNWLLFSWYHRRNVMLADEMGLGKTIQSVATLHHLWSVEKIRGPFLVLAPLSTLSHWQREFETWTQMNAIVYHGSNEARELIRAHEFYFETGRDGAGRGAARDAKEVMGLFKFHVLITSYEVIRQDLSVFRKIPWRYMVVDEAHRLKNKLSSE